MWSVEPVPASCPDPRGPIGEVKRTHSARAGGGCRAHAVLEAVGVDAGIAVLWLETRCAHVAAASDR